jgi:hypothetical protein
MQFDSTTTAVVVAALLCVCAGAVYLVVRRRGAGRAHGYAAATVEEKYREQLAKLAEQLQPSPARKAVAPKRIRKRLKITLILYIKERFGLTITRPADIDRIGRLPKVPHKEERIAALKAVYEQVYTTSNAPSSPEQMQRLCREAVAALEAVPRREKAAAG